MCYLTPHKDQTGNLSTVNSKPASLVLVRSSNTSVVVDTPGDALFAQELAPIAI